MSPSLAHPCCHQKLRHLSFSTHQHQYFVAQHILPSFYRCLDDHGGFPCFFYEAKILFWYLNTLPSIPMTNSCDLFPLLIKSLALSLERGLSFSESETMLPFKALASHSCLGNSSITRQAAWDCFTSLHQFQKSCYTSFQLFIKNTLTDPPLFC